MAGLVHNTHTLVNNAGQGGRAIVNQRPTPVLLPPTTNPKVEEMPVTVNDAEDIEADDQPNELDIVINNVVCSFSVGCHLNLRQIALDGENVEFRRESGMVSMKIRNPYTTASIWSSGKITCTGATSENTSKMAARRYSRILQKLGFRVRFRNFKVVNVLGTCTMPFAIRLVPFSQANKPIAQYEPELHPGVTYKIKEIRATLKIFSTGSVTVTAPSVSAVQQSIERIFPLVYDHRKKRICDEDMPRSMSNQLNRRDRSRNVIRSAAFSANPVIDPEEEDVDDVEPVAVDDGCESDQSWG